MSGRHDQSRYAFLRDNDYRYLVVPLVRCPAPTFALRGDLGLTIARVDPARDPAMVTPTAKRVRPDGAAATAGLVVGDQLVRVDSHLVTDREVALFGPLTKVRPGDDVELQLADGRKLRVRALTPTQPAGLAQPVPPERPTVPVGQDDVFFLRKNTRPTPRGRSLLLDRPRRPPSILARERAGPRVADPVHPAEERPADEKPVLTTRHARHRARQTRHAPQPGEIMFVRETGQGCRAATPKSVTAPIPFWYTPRPCSPPSSS